jgi:glycosyltransferase involved in cell wall biosynthesis
LVTNPAFDDVLGDYKPLLRLNDPPDPVAVADKLAVLIGQSPAEWTAMGAALRERTVQAHGLDRLMDRLVALWSE